MASFIALLFAKNMALLPLGEPKIGTENDLATLALRRLQRLRRSLRELEKEILKSLNFPLDLTDSSWKTRLRSPPRKAVQLTIP